MSGYPERGHSINGDGRRRGGCVNELSERGRKRRRRRRIVREQIDEFEEYVPEDYNTVTIENVIDEDDDDNDDDDDDASHTAAAAADDCTFGEDKEMTRRNQLKSVARSANHASSDRYRTRKRRHLHGKGRRNEDSVTVNSSRRQDSESESDRCRDVACLHVNGHDVQNRHHSNKCRYSLDCCAVCHDRVDFHEEMLRHEQQRLSNRNALMLPHTSHNHSHCHQNVAGQPCQGHHHGNCSHGNHSHSNCNYYLLNNSCPELCQHHSVRHHHNVSLQQSQGQDCLCESCMVARQQLEHHNHVARQQVQDQNSGCSVVARMEDIKQPIPNQSRLSNAFGFLHMVYNIFEMKDTEMSVEKMTPVLMSTASELKQKSCDWFYDHVSRRFKRFGSAKVVRTLHKHSSGSKFHSDNESDSGYDPSLYSSFSQSGSSVRARSRPSLQAAFPEIVINRESENEEIDNGLYPPPPITNLSSPNGHAGYQTSPNTSLESIPSPREPPVPNPRRSVTTPTQTNDLLDNNNQIKEERDVYKEAFEKNKKTEEAKFKIRFDNLLADMQQSFESLSPRDGQVPSNYGTSSYGDLMTTYRGRVKELLVSLSQRLELAVESFDETCANNPTLTSQKVRQMISKLVEDKLGESLDLTSDEAVSDLSSMSDDSGEHKSFEDQIAQAVIARVLELHRNITGLPINFDEVFDSRDGVSPVPENQNVKRVRNLSYTICDDKHGDKHGHSSFSEGNDSAQNRNSSESEDRLVDRNANSSVLENTDCGQLRNSPMTEGANRRKGEIGDSVKRKHSDISIKSHNGDNVVHTAGDDSVDYADDGEFNVFDGSMEDAESDDESVRINKDISKQDSRRSHDKRPRTSSSSSSKGDTKIPSKDEVDAVDDIIDERKLLQEEFEKLRSFAKEVVPRPLYEEVKVVEEVEPEPIEESIECVKVDHEESQMEFSSRFYTYDKVHDSENRGLPDFSDLDYEFHDFGINEVDPDLLSMNLAPILEETEEELEDEKENETEYEQDWRGNWIFKGAGGMDSYTSLSKNRIENREFSASIMVPKPGDEFTPKIGNKWVEDVSDMSENEDRDSDGLSDEENSFYAKTSEEIARITRKTTSAPSNQTDVESEAESVTSRHYSSSFSDAGTRGHRLDQNSFESRSSDISQLKLSEELVPAEGDDPKFEIPPLSLTVPEGEPAKLTCRVSGTQPLDVFWYRVKDDVEELENNENYDIVKEGNRHRLTMYNMTRAEHAGQYMCIAMNEKGRCCQYFILAMKKNTQEQKAPEFLKTLSDIEVTEGQSVKFRVKVKGYPQPRVVWFKDGQLLLNQLNYKTEKFGNRDYLLTIESAGMDEDAEYSVLAKNVAGEVRSSAQLIVEPKNKPETESDKIKTKSDSIVKSQNEKEKGREPTPEWPELSYLPHRRAGKTSSSTSSTAKKTAAPTSQKDEHNLANISQKVAMTKESVTEVAEDMLASSKEESARNVRKATTSVLDYLNNTDSMLIREKGMDAPATSTPRNSDSERIFNPDNHSSVIGGESNLTMETQSDESHKSEMSFSFTQMPTGARNDSSAKKDGAESSENKAASEKRGLLFSNDSSQNSQASNSTSSPENIYIDMNEMRGNAHNTSDNAGDGSEPLVVNLGPKRENKERFTRDYYVTDTPTLARRTPPTSPRDSVDRTKMFISPPTSPRGDENVSMSTITPPATPSLPEEEKRAHTEEKIYLAASNVYHLENKVQSLQDKMRAINALQEQDKMARLESQVASTVAQVSSSEKQVQDVERAVTGLQQPTVTKMAPQQPKTGYKSKQAPKPPPQRPITPPPQIDKPEPTFLKGSTREDDLPESRTEFNEEYGEIELPSVSRLKAMFGQNKSDDKDSSIKRIHSITARSVPKEQLEKLRETNEDNPRSRVVVVTNSAASNPGRATSITTGQQIKQVPNMPKQVYQSSDMKKSQQTVASGAQGLSSTQSSVDKQTIPIPNIQIATNVKNSDGQSASSKVKQTMHINISANNVNRPANPVANAHSSQPMKTSVPNNAKPTTSNSQSKASVSSSSAMKTGNDMDTDHERKAPKIKTGAISAMSKLWEKRAKEKVTDDEIPEILEYD